MNRSKKKICLNMIVKNETRVLGRLFRSLHKYVDYFVIVDTGSTDGTPELIKSEMAKYGIEGEIHHREWVNFGVNRQQALELAVAADKADWLLFIDADEELNVVDAEFFERLEPGVTYQVEKLHGEIGYFVPSLIDVRQNRWRWQGPVHNYLQHLSGPRRSEKQRAVSIIYHSGQGAKSHGVTKEEKYLRDARILNEHLNKYPDCSRSVFYLGQSFRDAGKPELAREAYQRRTRMGGWEEEVFVAQLEVGRMSIRLGESQADVMRELLQAYTLRPERAEPLYELAKYFRIRGDCAAAFPFARAGCDTLQPDDSLFVARSVYDWRLADELAVSAYGIRRFEESMLACEHILQRAIQGMLIPNDDVKRIRQNRNFALRKLTMGRITARN